MAGHAFGTRPRLSVTVLEVAGGAQLRGRWENWVSKNAGKLDVRQPCVQQGGVWLCVRVLFSSVVACFILQGYHHHRKAPVVSEDGNISTDDMFHLPKSPFFHPSPPMCRGPSWCCFVKVWMGVVVDPPQADDEAVPRTVTMTWGEVCDVQVCICCISSVLL